MLLQKNVNIEKTVNLYSSRKHASIILTPLNPILHYFFLISAQKHRLWVLGEAVLTSTHNVSFEQKYEKWQIFSSDNLHCLVVKFSIYLNRHVFVMVFLD